MLKSEPAKALESFAKKHGVISPEEAEKLEAEELPRLPVFGGDTPITKSADALFAKLAVSGRFFLRGGTVVTVSIDERGMARFREVSAVEACSLFEQFVRFVKISGDKEIPTVLKKDQAEKYLGAVEVAKKHLPEILAVSNCPIITVRNGQAQILKSGYDSVMKTFVNYNEDLPDVTLEEAISYLKGVLKDFDFATPGDYSRALASLITPALKMGGLINGNRVGNRLVDGRFAMAVGFR